VPLYDWLATDLHTYLTEVHPNAEDPTAPLFPGRYSRAEQLPSGATRNSYKWDTPINTDTFYNNYLKPALAAVGLPISAPADTTTGVSAVRGVRLHDLRHTFAVLSLSAGEHYMQVSKWLGHESYVTTLNVYGDWIPEEEGGKRNPLARPTAPISSPATPANNVVPFRRRSALGS
jgi:integrase